ncbi:MAG: hypothetical protein EBY26_03825 [Microbacteriaceae bacterium]|nr:hypothetical protein [Microbacteriaceae bacterium]
MTFILAEDSALRAYLDDIYVADDKNPTRKVGVWFGQPDIEIKQQTFPYITIDLIDVSEATDRAMRGVVEVAYTPGVTDSATPLLMQYPIPYNLDYQITTYSRQPRHDRSLLNTMMQNKFGHRYRTLHITEDNTNRSMFLMGMVKRDRTEQDRRLFVNALTVRVFSELLPSSAMALAPQVTSVVLTNNYYVNNTLVNPFTA